MGLLRRLFGSKDKTGAEAEKEAEALEETRKSTESDAVALERAGVRGSLPITKELLKQLFPIRNLSDEEVETFALGRTAEVFEAGTVLFKRDQQAESIFYLLEGTVRMEVGEGTQYVVQANTAKARFPLCSSKRYSATAMAETPVQVLRVSPKIMRRTHARDTSVRFAIDPADPSIPEIVRSSRLFQGFCEFYRED